MMHLGCGLDSRVFRLNPPTTVRWFDLDVPAVIELRRQIYSEHDRYQMIGSSVTDPDWLDKIPTDRPVLVIAEGLLPYLTESQVRQLLQRLTDRFSTGELLFDGALPWIVKLMKILCWGTRDGRQLEQWNPRLRYLAETSALALFSKIPVWNYRMLFRLGNAIPGIKGFNRLYRFEF